MLDENFRRIRAEKIQMSTPERVEAAALSGSIDVLSQDPAFLRQGFKYADVEYMAKRLGLDRAVAVSQLTGARSPMQDSRDALLKMISHLKENPGNVNALKLEKWTGNPTAVRQILQKNIYEYRQVGNDQ
ncbi:MAG: hypothetical protein JST16_16830 [Bdellovibrionales bacterium]|nr:hypothetical protein [Bdellovibrionales bacterium]